MLFIEIARRAGRRRFMGTSTEFRAAVRRSSDTSTEHPKQKTNLEFECGPSGAQRNGEVAATQNARFRIAGPNASAATAQLRVALHPRLIVSAIPRHLEFFTGRQRASCRDCKSGFRFPTRRVIRISHHRWAAAIAVADPLAISCAHVPACRRAGGQAIRYSLVGAKRALRCAYGATGWTRPKSIQCDWIAISGLSKPE